MNIIKKHDDYQLAYGLTNREFRCKCGFLECQFTIFDHALLKAYEEFRKIVDMPLTITSGYRCQRHHYINVYNGDLQKLTKSQHLLGKAIDISIANLVNKFQLATLVEIAKTAGFKFIKTYETRKFIHMDTREEEMKWILKH